MSRPDAQELQRRADLHRLASLFVQVLEPVSRKWALLEIRTGRIIAYDELRWPLVKERA